MLNTLNTKNRTILIIFFVLNFSRLLNILNVFSSLYAECWRPLTIKSDSRSFRHQVDFKLSQTYNNVVAIAIQCVSHGDSPTSITEYWSDARFTFKNANGTASGTVRSIYTSKYLSTGTWTTDDKNGIQLSFVSIQTYWNPIHCDIINITTGEPSNTIFWCNKHFSFIGLVSPRMRLIKTRMSKLSNIAYYLSFLHVLQKSQTILIVRVYVCVQESLSRSEYCFSYS